MSKNFVIRGIEDRRVIGHIFVPFGSNLLELFPIDPKQWEETDKAIEEGRVQTTEEILKELQAE